MIPFVVPIWHHDFPVSISFCIGKLHPHYPFCMDIHHTRLFYILRTIQLVGECREIAACNNAVIMASMGMFTSANKALKY